MRTAVWWIRRDLRVEENSALARAAKTAERIVPLVILDDRFQPSLPSRRNAVFLCAVENLRRRLEEMGGGLLVRPGRPEEVLPLVMRETGAQVAVAEEDFSAYAQQRDEALQSRIALELVSGLTILPPHSILQGNGRPYAVYTAFANACRKLPFSTARKAAFPGEQLTNASLGWNQPGVLPAQAGLIPTEDLAHRQLADFLQDRAAEYGRLRDFPALEGTSRLSVVFRFGLLSAGSAMRQAEEFRKQAEPSLRPGFLQWQNELLWRDFFHYIFFHFPHARTGPFKKAWKLVHWRTDPAGLQAWKQGETGYPIVDAGMRQLLTTGWMHNRVRMIVASFLVKDLLISWREGEAWFMQQLVDGDPAVNNGNWQWVTGCGTDAAPYFRIFNPVLQGQKFDPDGRYVRQWLPELSRVPDRFIHSPWLMPEADQNKFQCRLGVDYPRPLVDHAQARQIFLDKIKRETAGQAPEGRA